MAGSDDSGPHGWKPGRSAPKRLKHVAVLLLVPGGCGDGPALPDAGNDARAIVLPGCAPDFDHAYLARRIEFLPPDQGKDVDGDGSVDNLIGTVALAVNGAVASAVASGETLATIVYPGLTIPPPATDVELRPYALLVRDADNPRDASNNFDGGGLIASLSVFDASCAPRPIAIGTQNGTVITARSEATNPAAAGGLLDIQRAEIEGQVSADGTLVTVYFSGAYSSCTLDRSGSVSGGDSILRVFTAFGLRPDIDLDGDGLEQIVLGPTNQIAGCVDGDGTPIDNPACACDPRIADGFSFYALTESVPVAIVGTMP